ncbi:MAG: type II CAAX endopeptidase family protein [Woeseiaceae bacterium]|nr:type II CAAX endopeptidase family protein [Woeseiaceae bacterium]
MHFLDHAFFALVAVVLPIVGYFSFRRLLKRAAAGEQINPMHLYRFTALAQWILFVLLFTIWFAMGRPLAALGFTLEADGRLLAGVALTGIAVAFLLQQLRVLRNASASELGSLDRQLGDLKIIFPRTRSELAGFYGLSLTAGIVEETIWRGFLFWYLGTVMPLWAAALISAIGFGLAHAYQGFAKVPRIILVGSVFSALYLLTGSLWLSMLLHAVVDMLQGHAIFDALQRQRVLQARP